MSGMVSSKIWNDGLRLFADDGNPSNGIKPANKMLVAGCESVDLSQNIPAKVKFHGASKSA
jgi:hypothetical protein